MEAITIEETLKAPIDRVWRAWTDPEQLCPWFALRANVVPKRGGAYELFWDLAHPERQSTLGCRVLSSSRSDGSGLLGAARPYLMI